jgi:hypothetical protein
LAAEAHRGRRARLRFRTLIRGWPWYYETTAIYHNENLLRSIPNTQDYFNREMGAWAVAPYAFKPHPKRDTDGMSFFREDFVKRRAVAEANTHPNKARVARISVPQFRELDLEAQIDPNANALPGHTIVPEMQYKKNRTDNERQRTKDRSQRLAQFATKNGVYAPPGLPDPVPRQNVVHLQNE